MSLTPLENHLLGHPAWDTHGVDEFFGLIRAANPLYTDQEVFQCGRTILASWHERGWLQVSPGRKRAAGARSVEEMFERIDTAWLEATHSSRGLPEVDLSEQAFRDVEWLRGVEQSGP